MDEMGKNHDRAYWVFEPHRPVEGSSKPLLVERAFGYVTHHHREAGAPIDFDGIWKLPSRKLGPALPTSAGRTGIGREIRGAAAPSFQRASVAPPPCIRNPTISGHVTHTGQFRASLVHRLSRGFRNKIEPRCT
ncbi:MAG TPA: hypothetical protein VKX49_20080 [Bryobacteraceae bacterium]|nr:hypothetical protein [Bryobacteraceae bacterium]